MAETKWFVFIGATWSAIYVGSLALSLWRSENRRGAIVAAFLTAFVLAVPVGVQLFLISQ